MIGIYYIKCILNKKVYIGSSVNIKKRLEKHMSFLKHNKHFNQHLQNAFNKYGKEWFKIGIIDLCEKEELIEKEQFYMNKNTNLFNIIISDITRPSITKEVAQKISESLQKKYSSGFVSKSKGIKTNVIPWNKGKHYESTDHLKVHKKFKNKEKTYKEKSEILRNKSPEIYVYDIKNNFLGKWRSPKDLEEESKKENFILAKYMILRNISGRQGYSPFLLQSVNILTSNKLNKPYKGLYFKLVKKVHHKSDEFGETLEVGNTEPSISLND